MAKFAIDFKSLGVRITKDTPQEEVDRLCAAHPVVKKLIEKLSKDGKEKTSTGPVPK